MSNIENELQANINQILTLREMRDKSQVGSKRHTRFQKTINNLEHEIVQLRKKLKQHAKINQK